MLSFQKLIIEKDKTHAYVLGAKQHFEHINNPGSTPKLLQSPFEKDTPEENEWFEGYMDSFFVYHGIKWQNSS